MTMTEEQKAKMKAGRERAKAESNRKQSLDISSENDVEVQVGEQASDAEPTIEELRQRRKPLSGADRLTAEQRPGFHRRFVNDTPGNVQQYLDAGYRPVKAKRDGKMSTGHGRAGDGNSIQGSTIQTSVGQGLAAILMELPIELYNEDMAAMNAQTDATEAGIKKDFAAKASKNQRNHEDGADGAVYGDVQITRNGRQD